MGKIIRLKKFKSIDNLLKKVIVIVFFANFFIEGLYAYTLEHVKVVPVLKHLGILPVQVDGDIQNQVESQLELINQAVGVSIRESKRFRVIHDSLTQRLWTSASRRKIIQEQYGLDAFAAMDLAIDGDVIFFTFRILSPMLEPYLQERETLKTKEFFHLSYDQLLKIIRRLIFRVLNRIPIDVNVTSIQGKYITLSGGYEQGLEIGDQVKLVRASIAQRHPVLLTWKSFDNKFLGTAKIIEVNQNVSIARLVELVEEDSIKIGDGLKSNDMPSRVEFMRESINNEDNHFKFSRGIILGQQSVDSKPTILQNEKPSTQMLNNSDDTRKVISQNDSETLSKDNNMSATSILENISNFKAEKVTYKVGYFGWGYKGPGSTGSRFNWYRLVNFFGATINKNFGKGINIDIGANSGLGNTRANKGSFSFYNLNAQINWFYDLTKSTEIVKYVKFGGLAGLSGFGVVGEGIGGYDFLKNGVYGSLVGGFSPAVSKLNLEWQAGLRIIPILFGRLGYDQRNHSIRTNFGWELFGRVIKIPQTPSLVWGVDVEYGKQSIFDGSSQYLVFRNYSISGLCEMKF